MLQTKSPGVTALDCSILDCIGMFVRDKYRNPEERIPLNESVFGLDSYIQTTCKDALGEHGFVVLVAGKDTSSSCIYHAWLMEKIKSNLNTVTEVLIPVMVVVLLHNLHISYITLG